MIAFIQGTVAEVGEDHLVIQVGGVGVQVHVPRPLAAQTSVGEARFLHTHLVVREDALTLYGFETAEARRYFTLLLSVNGIGPRLALAALSTLSPEAIRRAVFHEQAEVFRRVPGVGKKTAQRILLHLQDKLPAQEGLEVVAQVADADAEVLDALVALGYSVVEAQAAIQAIPREAPQDVETRLRLALQYFS